MQKNLKWKLILILVFMGICTYYFIGPKEKGAGLLSRLNLGLDLKGGVHLVLQVVTDEALNQELLQDSDRIAQEFRDKSILYTASKKGNGFSVEITGISSDKNKEARDFLDTNYSKKYTIRTTTVEGKTDFSMSLMGIRERRESTVKQALETIRRRVDNLGVTEPSLQIYGSNQSEIQDQIIVELPGIDDPDRVKDLIGKSAQLKLCLKKKENGGPFPSIERAVADNGGKISEEYEILPYRDDRDAQDQLQYMVVSKIPVITGKDLKTARRGTGDNGTPAVNFYLTSEGANRFEEATGKHVGENLAIVLDNSISSAPTIQSKIGAEGIITGSFTVQAAEDLALLLRSGALPASLVILHEQTVGASLGNDSIKSGIYASLIGFGLIVIGIIIYYKMSGINAIICLVANLLILMGFLGAVGATLTLPGIAGIILTMGMAVDANILIFERIREELRGGKTVRAAIDTSFNKVFWTIFDANVTTLISAAFLFTFGTGPIRGFAVTLTVGLLANMFTAIYVSHRLFEWTLGTRKAEGLSI